MSKARELAELGNAYSDGALSNRNLIINGAMNVAQRGTSFTADNVYTLDRWKSGDGTGGTPARTLSQETFSLGQTDVPNARYYLRHNQTGASTNGNSSLAQAIENVTRFDGNTVTLSFYAKANATMNIDVLLIQSFGTGGSPSADVTLTETVSIGTSWAKYTVTKTLGSLSGKTLGTDGEQTSSLKLNINFKPTTTFTFDATLFQLEVGDTATPFEHRSYGQELALCQRYLFRMGRDISGQNTAAHNGAWYSTGSFYGAIHFPVKMRGQPTFTYGSVTDGYIVYGAQAGYYPDSVGGVQVYGLDSIVIYYSDDLAGVAGQAGWVQLQNDNAYLQFDAEL